MTKALQSTFELSVPSPTRGDFVRVIGECDFDYFTSHFQQIIDKRRRLVPMELNPFQKRVFEKLLPMIDPKTRLDRSRTVIFLKSRRVGATTGTIAFVNFLLSYVEDIENLNVLHLFPTGDTAAKLYNTKVKDIVTGVHPDLMPTIYKDSTSSSVVLNYDNILGVRRHNFYELASAGANSLRGSDFHVAIMDELASYRHPEDVEAVVAPMMPPHGFSLTIYASTFDDKMGPYFKEKIITALENPEEYEVIFVPFWWSYPEEPYGLNLSDIELTDYDQKVILPAMEKDNFPFEKRADSIEWYHRMSTTMSKINMQKEFPSTVEEILAIGENKACFSVDSLKRQEKNILPDSPYQLVTDTLTGVPELKATDSSPILVYKAPIAGEKYVLTCDPIGSNSDDSDFFAASIWRKSNNEQVAILYVRGVMVEDMAELVAGLHKIYNRAIICPESNMSEALQACLRAKGIYSFYYTDKTRRAKKEAGIRTTVASKPNMIDKTQLLLDGDRIIIHSAETLRQMKLYEKKVKSKAGGGSTVAFSAPKQDHDDLVSTVLIYAGMLDQRELTGRASGGFVII